MLHHLIAPVNRAAARSVGVPRALARATGVALTFDDGPHPEGTPAVLDRLAAAGAVATFFLIGEQVERRPELAARIAAAGHLVAVHGYRHHLQMRMSPAAVAADIARGRAVIEDAVGDGEGGGVIWHRPPYGIYSPAGLRTVREIGLQPLLWTRWGKDWRKFTSPRRIAARATRALVPGDVILLHDADFYSSRNSHRRTAAALEIILTELGRRKIDTVLPV